MITAHIGFQGRERAIADLRTILNGMGISYYDDSGKNAIMTKIPLTSALVVTILKQHQELSPAGPVSVTFMYPWVENQ